MTKIYIKLSISSEFAYFRHVTYYFVLSVYKGVVSRLIYLQRPLVLSEFSISLYV